MTAPARRIVKVCDHALLRFLQRVGGVDVEAMRTTLEASLNRAAEAAAKVGSYDMVIVADGLKYVVEGNKVVTVLDAKMSVHKARHMRRNRSGR